MEHGRIEDELERGKDFPSIPIFLIIIGEQLLIFDKFNSIEKWRTICVLLFISDKVRMKICRKDEAYCNYPSKEQN